MLDVIAPMLAANPMLRRAAADRRRRRDPAAASWRALETLENALQRVLQPQRGPGRQADVPGHLWDQYRAIGAELRALLVGPPAPTPEAVAEEVQLYFPEVPQDVAAHLAHGAVELTLTRPRPKYRDAVILVLKCAISWQCRGDDGLPLVSRAEISESEVRKILGGNVLSARS